MRSPRTSSAQLDGDRLELGRAQEQYQPAPVDRREPALLELHPPAGRERDRRGRSRARARPASPRRARPPGRRVEVAAPERLGDLRLDAERRAGDQRRVASPHLGAREAGVQLHAERRRGPGRPPRTGAGPSSSARGKRRRRRSSSASPWRSSQIIGRGYPQIARSGRPGRACGIWPDCEDGLDEQASADGRPPARSQRVLAARRGQQDQGDGGARRRARDARAGAHRPRRDERRRRALQGLQGARRQADPRAGGLLRRRSPGGPVGARARGRAQSPHPARGQRRRLSQPGQADVRQLPGGVRPRQGERGPGAARAPLRRA